MATPASSAAPTILVVEDDPIVGRLLVHQLRRSGFEISWVKSGEEALAHLQAQAYAVVLTDLSLPGCSGLELLRDCRAHWPQTEVILATGDTTDEVMTAALEAGAFYFLKKPFDHLKLVGVLVQRAAQMHRLAQASTPLRLAH